ncbi:family 16 glycosylhydrolase [Bacteroides sp.]
MKFYRFLCVGLLLWGSGSMSAQKVPTGYELVWNDEFDVDGKPDENIWEYEHGFVRNNEAQWYQPDNAYCKDGKLIIEGRKETVLNPNYDPSSSDWRKNRKEAKYTSSCLTTRSSKSWTYGRFEIRAKIPAHTGCWPAIWTLGTQDGWPHCGEIDIMEFYQIGGTPHILANLAWGSATSQYNPNWNTKTWPYADFVKENPDWANEFHIWRMDWDEKYVKIYLDDKLLNMTPLKGTVNPQTGFYPYAGVNPFKRPQYLLLNLALGGDNGGSLSNTPFPCRYEIDYVRVYQKTTTGISEVQRNKSVDILGTKKGIDLLFERGLGEKAEVSVYELSGVCVYEDKLLLASTELISLPVSFIPGYYVVKVVYDGTTTTAKVVVC